MNRFTHEPPTPHKEGRGGGGIERDGENHNCCLILDGWLNGWIPVHAVERFRITVSDRERLKHPGSSLWTNCMTKYRTWTFVN